MAKALTFEQSSDKFAILVVEGYTLADAYRLTHPGCKSTNEHAVAQNGWVFSRNPRVKAKIEAERERMRERHRSYADTLIDHLEEETESCWRDNKTLAPVLKQAELLGRFLGIDKQTIDIKARVGALDTADQQERLNFLAERARAAN